MGTTAPLRRAAVPLLALLAVVLVGTGLTQLARSTSSAGAAGATDATGPASDRTSATGTTGATGAPAPPPEVRAAWRPGAPERISIPSLGVEAGVVPVKAPGGTLVPPSDARLLGWWASGAPAGAPRGSTLVAGHTLHDGGGALDDLEDVRRGDRVVVRTGRDRVVYRVGSVRTLSKSAVTREAARLFSQEAAGRLVLVTCEDWDGSAYRSNVVVTARPVRQTV